jgi:hypothetical protein
MRRLHSLRGLQIEGELEFRGLLYRQTNVVDATLRPSSSDEQQT